MSIIRNILSQDAFWIVNKKLSQEVGIEAALLLSELIGRESYMTNKLEIDGEDYFQATSESLESSTSLSYKVQRKCLKQLKNVGFIKTKLRGIPAKQHFTISHNQIEHFVRTSSAQKEELLYKNNSIRNIYKKEESSKSVESVNTDLFGNKKIKGKHLFSISPYFEFKNFEKSLQKEAELGIDLRFYFEALVDWSAQGNKKLDWIATARSFMRKDKQDNKLVILNNINPKNNIEAMKRFIQGNE